jgi:hypothetical protein
MGLSFGTKIAPFRSVSAVLLKTLSVAGGDSFRFLFPVKEVLTPHAKLNDTRIIE